METIITLFRSLLFFFGLSAIFIGIVSTFLYSVHLFSYMRKRSKDNPDGGKL